MQFSIVGAGYVGLSLATLISKKYPVTLVDIIEEKVKLINNKKSPIVDKEIESALMNDSLNLKATTNLNSIINSDFIIIATPTNYSVETHKFDTSSVEEILNFIQQNSPNSTCIIKSTIPFGFTEHFCTKNNQHNIAFSPEFLREGKALYDNQYPSRIIVGIPNGCTKRANVEIFANVLKECAKNNPPTICMGSNEAESVKLFSNTYLAMRVAFFNELDTFAEVNKLNAMEVIEGVCADPRIGHYYNNPSLGYGGYCLPKDTKQLLSDYANIPNSLIKAIVDSNEVRKKYVVDTIKKKIKENGVVGIYRLIMKSNSDNFRDSSIIDIMNKLSDEGYFIKIYEPNLEHFNNYPIERDLIKFAENSDIILCNRYSTELNDYAEKLYCRDIFHEN